MALTGDGNTAAVGALNSATVYIFTRVEGLWGLASTISADGIWSLAFALDGSFLFVGDPTNSQVSVGQDTVLFV